MTWSATLPRSLAASRSRSRSKRRPHSRKRRVGVAVAALIVGLGSALLIFRGDVEDTIRAVIPSDHSWVFPHTGGEMTNVIAH